MTIDEGIRAVSYFMMFPAFTFFALLSWNQKQRLIAIAYAALSMFFALMLIGLTLGGFRYQYLPFLYVNTVVVVVMAMAVTYRATLIAWAALKQYAEDMIMIEELD